MDKPVSVQRVEPGRDLRGDPQRLAKRQRTFVAEPILERSARHVRGHDVARSVRFACIEDRHEVVVLDVTCGPRLVDEACAKGFVGGEPFLQKLQRDDVAVRIDACPVHDTDGSLT